MEKRFKLGLIASAVTSLVIGLGPSAWAQALQQVTMGITPSASSSLPRIAKEMGLYEKQGLDVKFVMFESASLATTALISGAANVAVSGSSEVVAAQIRDQKVVVIAPIFRGFSGSVVLAKAVAEKTGVAANAPATARLKALNQLTIAAPSATSALTTTLKAAALSEGADIRFVYMAMPAMTAALETGAIQGFIAAAPFWTPPAVKGSGVLWLSGPKGEFPAAFTPVSNVNLQAMRDFAQANPDLIKKHLAVVLDVAKAMDERPAEVKAAFAKVFPEVDQATVDMLFASDSNGWRNRPLTAQDVGRDIEIMRATGVDVPKTVDPADGFSLKS